MEKAIPIYTVDAFTDEPFRGNPAAVCLVPKGMVSEIFHVVQYLFCLGRKKIMSADKMYGLKNHNCKNIVRFGAFALLSLGPVLLYCLRVHAPLWPVGTEQPNFTLHLTIK